MINTHSRLKTTWTGGSGNLPPSLTIDDCLSEGIKLINQFRSSIEIVTEDVFKESIKKYSDLFSNKDFWSAKQHLIWFNGKDIQKAMQIAKPQYISLKNFYHSAINTIDLTKHYDFMEFKRKVENL